MTHPQLLRLATALVALGGVSFLAIATSAALAGVWDAAAFIGLCGLALCATVAWALLSGKGRAALK